jgi:hypothetical protein
MSMLFTAGKTVGMDLSKPMVEGLSKIQMLEKSGKFQVSNIKI